MREILTAFGIGLTLAWILERLPRLALALVRLAARLMPTQELREQMCDDWTADVITAEGPVSMVLSAIHIIFSVPSIRSGYGYKPIGLTERSSFYLSIAGLISGPVVLGPVNFILTFPYCSDPSGQAILSGAHGYYCENSNYYSKISDESVYGLSKFYIQNEMSGIFLMTLAASLVMILVLVSLHTRVRTS